MVAELAGIPRPEALDRLHTLLQMGLLEVVNA
jgi:DNA-binding IclR family transcriptional regulator